MSEDTILIDLGAGHISSQVAEEVFFDEDGSRVGACSNQLPVS
jgi:hypothetical protein